MWKRTSRFRRTADVAGLGRSSGCSHAVGVAEGMIDAGPSSSRPGGTPHRAERAADPIRRVRVRSSTTAARGQRRDDRWAGGCYSGGAGPSEATESARLCGGARAAVFTIEAVRPHPSRPGSAFDRRVGGTTICASVRHRRQLDPSARPRNTAAAGDLDVLSTRLTNAGDLVSTPRRSDRRSASFTGQTGRRLICGVLDRSTFMLTDSELERAFCRSRAGRSAAAAHRAVRERLSSRLLLAVARPRVETDGLRYHRTPAQQARTGSATRRTPPRAYAASVQPTLR